MQKKKLEEMRMLIDQAYNNFQTANWTHVYDGGDDASGWGGLCEGDRAGCVYCQDVADHAEKARIEGERAYWWMKKGRVDDASRAIDRAIDHERRFGPSISYEPISIFLVQTRSKLSRKNKSISNCPMY